MINYESESSKYNLGSNYGYNDSFDKIVSRYEVEDNRVDYESQIRESKIQSSIKSIEECNNSLERLKDGTDTMQDHLDEHHNCHNMEGSIDYLEGKKAEHTETLKQLNSKGKKNNSSKSDDDS